MLDNNFTDEDKKSIQEDIENFIYSDMLIDLFYSYREVKLTFNDFFSMKDYKEKSNIIDMINPLQIFMLCALKNINMDFYNNLITELINLNITNSLDNYTNGFINGIIRKILNLKTDEKTNKEILQNIRLIKVFNILDIVNEDGAFIVPDYFNEILTEKFNFDNPHIIRFFLYPILENYQFSNKNISEHFEDIIKSFDIEKVYNLIISAYKDNNYEFEIKERIIDYLEKIQSKLSPYLRIKTIDENTKIVKPFFIGISKVILEKIIFKNIEFIKQILNKTFKLIFNDFNNSDGTNFEVYYDNDIVQKIIELCIKNTDYFNITTNKLTNVLTWYYKDNKFINLIGEKLFENNNNYFITAFILKNVEAITLKTYNLNVEKFIEFLDKVSLSISDNKDNIDYWESIKQNLIIIFSYTEAYYEYRKEIFNDNFQEIFYKLFKSIIKINVELKNKEYNENLINNLGRTLHIIKINLKEKIIIDKYIDILKFYKNEIDSNFEFEFEYVFNKKIGDKYKFEDFIKILEKNYKNDEIIGTEG